MTDGKAAKYPWGEHAPRVLSLEPSPKTGVSGHSTQFLTHYRQNPPAPLPRAARFPIQLSLTEGCLPHTSPASPSHIRDDIIVLARRSFRMKHSAAVLDFHQIDELRHATRKLEPGTAHDIMRSYGITFEALEGEQSGPGKRTGIPRMETPAASPPGTSDPNR